MSETSAKRAHIIVVGNEKGGSGKSTTAMHLIVALMRCGLSVGSVDLDARQATLTRYLQNRTAFRALSGAPIPIPDHIAIPIDQAERFDPEVGEMIGRHDALVIDCPGSDTPLSRRAHVAADTLITPLNDSFIDFDVLGQVNPQTFEVSRPSTYSEMVFEQRKRRALGRLPPVDWIVMRNRLGHVEAKNRQNVAAAMEALSKRIGFRTAPGFSERVIFRELFLKGLTLLDLREEGVGGSLTVSHVAARAEVRALLQALNLPLLAGLDLTKA
jgi:chromosome partitioning protein